MSLSLAAFSNSKRLAASRMSLSSFLMYASSSSWDLKSGKPFSFDVGEVGVVGLDDSGQGHLERPHDRLWSDSVGLVVGHLYGATAVGFAESFLHRVSHAVGVEDGAAVEVAGAAADGLDQRSGRAQEAFLVGIENGYQRHFGQSRVLRAAG